MSSPRRLRVPSVLAAWVAASMLGALSVGCGLLLGVDYDEASIDRSGGRQTDGGFEGPCVPRACGADECGLLDDGCNGVMTCSPCSNGRECQAGRCRCGGPSCKERGAECGTLDDGCKRTLECGVCTVAQHGCNENVCTCNGRGCPDGGPGTVSCGSAPSGCDGVYVCGVEPGACPQEPDAGFEAVSVCGGGGQNLCGTAPCQPVGCSPGDCGKKSNGCDNVIDCGGCDGGVCGANGEANRCGCEKNTCARLGLSCGSVPDGCGGTLECGICEAPEQCGASGRCECIPSDRVQACAGRTCGYASNGCRSFHECGPPCDAGAP